MSAQRKKIVWIGSGILACLIVGLVMWQHRRPPAPPQMAAAQPGLRGRITGVSPSSITINSRRSGSHTYTLTATTAITLDGGPTTAAALKLGEGARIVSPDGVTAAQVTVRTRRAGAGRPGRNAQGGGGFQGGGSLRGGG